MATHRFQPTHYHTAIGAHAPVLHIASGDTVITTTVDAMGGDASGQQVTPGGNPQTGPFFIEGAEPGDTLVVHFDRLTLNRDSGVTATVVAANVVDPSFARELPAQQRITWQLDHAQGMATVTDSGGKLDGFTIPVRPMLGCFGVAPPRGQAISTATSAEHGGNMDYKGFEEGVTVYLPVYQEGALLFVGDGHAAQGDGELNGDALETSMDVEFTVDLIRGKSTQGPRMENEEYLMASGIANSLPEALQIATTELARWLERDYKLSANESNVVLGTSIRYDIAEVVDPQVHIVAKISKAALATLTK